jgi:hypothetical protein
MPCGKANLTVWKPRGPFCSRRTRALPLARAARRGGWLEHGDAQLDQPPRATDGGMGMLSTDRRHTALDSLHPGPRRAQRCGRWQRVGPQDCVHVNDYVERS